LPDAQPGQQPQRTASVSPLGVLVALLVVGIIIYAMSSSKPTATSAPVAPLPQVVAPVATQVVPKHVVKKHKQKHAAHTALAAEPVEIPAAEPPKADAYGEASVQSQRN
jgi:hypothetical protein